MQGVFLAAANPTRTHSLHHPLPPFLPQAQARYMSSTLCIEPSFACWDWCSRCQGDEAVKWEGVGLLLVPKAVKPTHTPLATPPLNPS